MGEEVRLPPFAGACRIKEHTCGKAASRDGTPLPERVGEERACMGRGRGCGCASGAGRRGRWSVRGAGILRRRQRGGYGARAHRI